VIESSIQVMAEDFKRQEKTDQKTRQTGDSGFNGGLLRTSSSDR